jgi:hypothetical protein
MIDLSVDRALAIYSALADRSEARGVRDRLSKHLMKRYVEGEKDEHRLTVEGLSYLRDLYREIDSRNWRGLAFWSSRCFRSEARRIILAFALPTASILVGRFCASEAFDSRPDAGINGRVGHIVADCTGWVLMGPVAAGLRSIILQERFRGGLVLADPARPRLEHAAFRHQPPR